MRKYNLVIGCVILWLLVSCQADEQMTPTPFPPTVDNAGLGQIGSSITPVPAVLSDVVANPEFYEGAHLQVSGQYFRRPLLVCGVDPHPSPAGWDLMAGDVSVAAGGFNKQLRLLLPDGITMTVIGRLTHWQGPVGCGKQAVAKEMWYLDVVKMVDPAQLARVTLTPGTGSGDLISDGGIVDDLFTPVAETETTPTAAGDVSATSPPVAPPTNTTIATQAVPIETLGAGFTPVATDDIGVSTPIASGTGTAVSTATITGTGTAVTPTPASSTPGTAVARTATNTPRPDATATPTRGNPLTPLPTANVSTRTVIPQTNSLGELDFVVVDLGASEADEWMLDLLLGEEVLISVVGEPEMDIGIKIYDADLTQLLVHDEQLAGKAETVAFDPDGTNDYKLQISERSRKPGGYLLAIGIDPLLLLPQGMLKYDFPAGSTIYLDEAHYWFFKGEQGDKINLTASSEAGSSLSVSVLEADGAFLGELDDEIVLPETGWFILELEELALNQNSYEITVSKE